MRATALKHGLLSYVFGSVIAASVVDAPGGLSSAAVPPGTSPTGKLYFDVVGAEPNSVVYNDGVQDLLVWVP